METFRNMSDIKADDVPSDDSADEKDWEAAKAFFENLKTQKPRPVRNLLKTKRFLVASTSTIYILYLTKQVLCCCVLLFACKVLKLMSVDFSHHTLSQPKPRYAVTIAVSSRTLFNMAHERKIYEEEGMEKYVLYQVEHENEPLKPGAAFPFVKVGPLELGRGPSKMDQS